MRKTPGAMAALPLGPPGPKGPGPAVYSWSSRLAEYASSLRSSCTTSGVGSLGIRGEGGACSAWGGGGAGGAEGRFLVYFLLVVF